MDVAGIGGNRMETSERVFTWIAGLEPSSVTSDRIVEHMLEERRDGKIVGPFTADLSTCSASIC